MLASPVPASEGVCAAGSQQNTAAGDQGPLSDSLWNPKLTDNSGNPRAGRDSDFEGKRVVRIDGRCFQSERGPGCHVPGSAPRESPREASGAAAKAAPASSGAGGQTTQGHMGLECHRSLLDP